MVVTSSVVAIVAPWVSTGESLRGTRFMFTVTVVLSSPPAPWMLPALPLPSLKVMSMGLMDRLSVGSLLE